MIWQLPFLDIIHSGKKIIYRFKKKQSKAFNDIKSLRKRVFNTKAKKYFP